MLHAEVHSKIDNSSMELWTGTTAGSSSPRTHCIESRPGQSQMDSLIRTEIPRVDCETLRQFWVGVAKLPARKVGTLDGDGCEDLVDGRGSVHERTWSGRGADMASSSFLTVGMIVGRYSWTFSVSPQSLISPSMSASSLAISCR